MAKRRFKNQTCPNCGFRYGMAADLSNYCPECGQENYDLNAPFRHLLKEAAETVLHFDTKTIRTLRMLVLKPGFLTAEFIRGKRANYVKPMRFYIFISFLFFFLLSLFSHRPVDTAAETELQKKKSSGFSITFYGIKSSKLHGIQESQIDSVLQSRHITVGPLNRYIIKQLIRIGSGDEKEFLHLMTKNVSYMMFILMPFIGLLVYFLYRRQQPYYIGALIFSIHYHTLAFLLLMFLLLLGKIPGLSLIILMSPLALAVYLYISLRSVYRQSWLSTMLKTMLIGVLHFIALIILFLLTVFISMLIF